MRLKSHFSRTAFTGRHLSSDNSSTGSDNDDSDTVTNLSADASLGRLRECFAAGIAVVNVNVAIA